MEIKKKDQAAEAKVEVEGTDTYIMRVGENPVPFKLTKPVSVNEAFKLSGVGKLREGEVLAREGKVLNIGSDQVNPGDIITIEENDDNA